MESDWIISRPDLLGGKPCIKGTRISVEFILELLAGGSTPDEIVAAYPQITRDGFAAALKFAAESLGSEVVWPSRESA